MSNNHNHGIPQLMDVMFKPHLCYLLQPWCPPSSDIWMARSVEKENAPPSQTTELSLFADICSYDICWDSNSNFFGKCLFMCIRVYVIIYIYTYIHIYTCIHIYIYTYIHPYIQTYIHTYNNIT